MNVEKCKVNCLKAIRNSTSIPGKHTHKAFVCIVCDQFIIGKEKICWTSMKNLLDNEERLSVGRYENNFNCKLQKALRKQYLVPDNLLKDMLLSTRESLAVPKNKNGVKEKNNNPVIVVIDHF